MIQLTKQEGKFEMPTAAEKKDILIAMIDDMTAAIMDRSSQGYSRFLDSRSQLIKLLESYAENDKKKTAIVNSIIGDVDKYLECDVSLANKLEKDAAGY